MKYRNRRNRTDADFIGTIFFDPIFDVGRLETYMVYDNYCLGWGKAIEDIHIYREREREML